MPELSLSLPSIVVGTGNNGAMSIRFRKTFTSEELVLWLQSKFSENHRAKLKTKDVKTLKGNYNIILEHT